MEAVGSTERAFRPLLYLCKVFGLAPVSYINEKQTGGTRLTSLPRDLLWCVSVFICYLTNFPLSMYALDFSMWKSHAKLKVVAVLYKMSSCLCSTIVVLTLSTFNRRTLLQIFTLLAEVDQVLYEQAERLSLCKRTRCLIISQIVVLSVTFVPLQISYYVFFPKRKRFGHCALLIENFGYSSVILTIVLFMNIVFLLRQRYKHLNKWLDLHSGLWRERTRPSRKNILVLVDVESFGLPNCRIKYGRHQILELRQLYSKLRDIVHLANSCFGVPVLALSLWKFMCIVFVSYSSVLSIAAGVSEGKGPGEYTWTLSGLIWCVLCVFILFLIALSCHSTTEEYSKAQILVEKLMLSSGFGYETMNELRVLSLQLNNMKVSFTAGGFFTLDLPFVHGFVGAICTYVVILAQFQ